MILLAALYCPNIDPLPVNAQPDILGRPSLRAATIQTPRPQVAQVSTLSILSSSASLVRARVRDFMPKRVINRLRIY